MEKIDIIKSKFLKNLFDQNTYVISNDNEAVVIDAGAELEDVKKIVGNKKVLAVLMTHLHFDHFWNLDQYLVCFGCPVYIVEGFEDKFLNGKANGSYVIRMDFQKTIMQENIKYYAKKLKIGGFELEIFNTPGHAKDCVCILFKDSLFTGDTIFSNNIGRTDLPDSDNSDMKNSLKTIKSLDYKTAFPGHYDSATKQQIDQIIDWYL